MSFHAVKRHQCHLAWDNSIPPILRVKSGETVSFDCLDASNGQITRSSTVSSISTLVFAQLDQVNGPIYVEGAAPGDTLQIDVISVETADWGWTGLIPGFGLLSDEFTEPSLRIWKIDKKAGVAMYDDKDSNTSTGIRIPIRPFAGEMGVAPGEAGAFSTIPPYATGGNIDTKHLSAGATLFLPVQVEGALFSIGDGHAAQGDGEVCGTAIETPMNVQVRLSIRKDRPYTRTPHFTTSIASNASPENYYCTTGVEPDLREAARTAVRAMIDCLTAPGQGYSSSDDEGNVKGERRKLSRVEAYMLCSVAGDLRIHEIVDMPNYVVGMMFPRSIVDVQ